MGKYKVCVYAICKDEELFVRRWMDSMAEADEICVLDMGSEDGTVERLRALGAKVAVEPVPPWRLDEARNRALNLVPLNTDICVYVNLNERFHPGWRQKVEAAWAPGTTRLYCRYCWDAPSDDLTWAVSWVDRVHRRRGCQWTDPVHAVLHFDGGEIGPRYAEDVVLKHSPAGCGSQRDR